MTISIEQEALVCVLNSPPLQSQSSLKGNKRPSLIQDDNIVGSTAWRQQRNCNRTRALSSAPSSPASKPVDFLPDSTCDLDSVSFIDDECSSISDSSFTSDSTSSDKSVSFADDLVTEVQERERTPREDISTLYYSPLQIQRFRQQYRLERKLLAELEVDPNSSVTNEDISALLGHEISDNNNNKSNKRHRISRVVVVHNDKLETFFNPDDEIAKEEEECDYDSCNASAATSDDETTSLSTSTPETMSTSATSSSSNNNANDFFDNDSFWSGSITWY